MASQQYIVITLHCPGGFRQTLFFEEARRLPVETMSMGFSQIILVFLPSEISIVRDYASRADALRRSDPTYRLLQIGVAVGQLREPLPQPMRDDDEVVIQAFKAGLAGSHLWEEFDKIEFPTR